MPLPLDTNAARTDARALRVKRTPAVLAQPRGGRAQLPRQHHPPAAAHDHRRGRPGRVRLQAAPGPRRRRPRGVAQLLPEGEPKMRVPPASAAARAGQLLEQLELLAAVGPELDAGAEPPRGVQAAVLERAHARRGALEPERGVRQGAGAVLPHGPGQRAFSFHMVRWLRVLIFWV